MCPHFPAVRVFERPPSRAFLLFTSPRCGTYAATAFRVCSLKRSRFPIFPTAAMKLSRLHLFLTSPFYFSAHKSLCIFLAYSHPTNNRFLLLLYHLSDLLLNITAYVTIRKIVFSSARLAQSKICIHFSIPALITAEILGSTHISSRSQKCLFLHLYKHLYIGLATLHISICHPIDFLFFLPCIT